MRFISRSISRIFIPHLPNIFLHALQHRNITIRVQTPAIYLQTRLLRNHHTSWCRHIPQPISRSHQIFIHPTRRRIHQNRKTHIISRTRIKRIVSLLPFIFFYRPCQIPNHIQATIIMLNDFTLCVFILLLHQITHIRINVPPASLLFPATSCRCKRH